VKTNNNGQSERIFAAVKDFYDNRRKPKRQSGRFRRLIESRHVACQSGLEGAGLKNPGRLDSGQRVFSNLRIKGLFFEVKA